MCFPPSDVCLKAPSSSLATLHSAVSSNKPAHPVRFPENIFQVSKSDGRVSFAHSDENIGLRKVIHSAQKSNNSKSSFLEVTVTIQSTEVVIYTVLFTVFSVAMDLTVLCC